jgi:hypothetical protein
MRRRKRLADERQRLTGFAPTRDRRSAALAMTGCGRGIPLLRPAEHRHEKDHRHEGRHDREQGQRPVDLEADKGG